MKIKNRQQMLTMGAIALVALFAADKLILTPLGHAWTNRAKRIQKLKMDVAAGELLIKREDALTSRWAEIQKGTLPKNTSAAEQKLIKALDQWAKDSNLQVNSIVPQWKREGDDYTTLQCRIEGTGDLKSVSHFLYDMEKEPMALRLENVEISAHDTEGQLLTLGLVVSGLVLGGEVQ